MATQVVETADPPGPFAPPGAAHRRWTLALASLGVFLTTLDIVVVATALPTMRSHLHASLSDLEWTIGAYNLVFASLMLTGAGLGDRFGRRRMYVAGVLLFTAGSTACALSSSVGQLITFRVAQGAGAAIVLPLTLTLISDAFPLEKRGAAIGIWGGVSGLGVATGPVLGGAIVQGLSWQWIFWINVPVGLVVAALSAVKLRESRGPRPRLDLGGLVLVGVALLGLTWAPVRAPAVGWGSAETVAAFVVGALFLAAFLAWERRARYPMLPLGYFRRRGFSTANGVAFFQSVSLIGSLFLVTQLFQTGLGYSPLKAGVRILVWMATPLVIAPIAGVLADRYGNKPFMTLGLLMQGAGLGWLALVADPSVGYGTLVGPLIFSGIGISMVLPTVANAVIGSVPVDDSGVAAGTNSALREFGGVLGIAVAGAVFAANGSYASPSAYVDGFRPALAVAAAIAVAGVAAAALSPVPPFRFASRWRFVMTVDLRGSLAVVTGASRGFGRGIATALVGAGASVVGLARSGEALAEVADALGPGFVPVVGDVTDAGLARDVLVEYRPSVVVLNAGARPPSAPLHEQSWADFSRNWETDVRGAFVWVGEALRRPLAPGSVVVAVSSGAALRGSPLSGGYAGAKSTVRFVAAYAADESERAGLGLRFVTVLPQLTPATDLGAAAVAGYAARAGVTPEIHAKNFAPILTPAAVGAGIVGLVTADGPTHGEYLISGAGLRPVSAA